MDRFELVDSHAHLDAADFDPDREQVIDRAKECGVKTIVNIGATDGFKGAIRSIELSRVHSVIYPTVGIHPHDATLELDLDRLRQLALEPEVVAIGETGLDFYRDWSPKDSQYEWFEAQIELAKELDKPLVIHSRSAAEECLDLLQKKGADQVGGVFHCYDQDSKFAERLFELNFIVSVTGVVTFPKAENIHRMVKDVPLERMMVETDAPYLAPVPYRGKRCESAQVVETAKAIAEIKGISFEKVAQVTTENARRFYGIG